MISRKWLYSYRTLTARLHQVERMPASRATGFAVGSTESQLRQISANDELTESEPAKQALPITAGSKT